jgi:hypothetical protein
MRTLIAGILAACVIASAHPKAEESIEGFFGSDDYTVERSGKTVIVTKSADPLFTDADIFALSAIDLRRFGKWIKETGDKSADRVVWIMKVSVRNRYNKSSMQPVLRLSIRTSDLQKIEYSGFSSAMILNFAKVEHVDPIAAKGALDYCENNYYAQSFCLRLFKRLRVTRR